MAWHARYGEGDASGVPSRYASTARGGSAIGASAYFMREDDAPRRGSAYARPDPTGHVIAKQARRAFEASRREDESGGESLRYVRSLKYLPRERGEDGEDVDEGGRSARTTSPRERERLNESSTLTTANESAPSVSSFGYPTTNGGVGGVGAFAFPATRSVMWDPSAVAETTHISADAHAVSVSLGAEAAAALAERCAAAARESQNEDDAESRKPKALVAAGAFVASRRVLDRRGAFRASAALEIFAVGAPSASTAPILKDFKDGTDREEAWSSPVAVAIAAAPPGRDREALEAMTDMTSHRKGSKAQKSEEEEEEEDDDFRLVSTSPRLSAAAPWRARLAATTRRKDAETLKDGRVELVVSARVRVPAATFAATPIAPPRVADSPLSGARGKVSTGFLTMDRTRRLMLLGETDPRLSLDLPTVGVWVSGVTNPTHLAVWTACFRYVTSDALKDKATQRGAFLCLLCPPATLRAELGDDAEKKTRREGSRAPPATCYDVRLVEPRGVSPRTHVDLAATFACVPGEAAEAPLAPPPAIRAERNADAHDARSGAGDEKSADADRVTLRRRVVSSENARKETDAVAPATPIPTPSSESVLESRRRETRRERASPDWAPVYGAAPRTAYEAAAAAAAARAAAANAKLAASRGATPSSLMSPVSSLSPAKQNPPGFPDTSTPRLEGAARVVVEEQQRVIAELRAAVAFLETEMAELTRPVSAREREARARDLLGGLEGATDFVYAARDGELPGEDGDEKLEKHGDEALPGELLPGEPPTFRSNDATSSDPTSSDPSARGGASPASKSPLRKALTFARGGEAPATASDAALCVSFRSDEVDAMYGMDTPEGSVDGGAGDAAADAAEAEANKKAARRAAREEKKAAKKAKKAKKKKSRSLEEDVTSVDEAATDEARGDADDADDADDAENVETGEEDALQRRTFREERPERDPSLDVDDVKVAAAAEARALGTRAAARARFAETRSGFPAAPEGLPPDVPEPPDRWHPAQPSRRFSESPYVESAEEAEERGERVADPLPGGGARYPAEPHLAHAATGYAFGDEYHSPNASEKSEASDTDALLDASSLMVDPESMDGETAARAAAATRRDALFRLEDESRRGERNVGNVGDGAADGEAEAEETRETRGVSSSFSPRRVANLRAAVRAGLDPMYPVIDCSFEDEGADDEDERVEELLEKYGGGDNRVAAEVLLREEDDET